MKRMGLLLLLAAFLVSCGSKIITQQQKSFADKKWQKSQNLIYSFTISDTSARYDISTTVKHFDDFPFDRVQLSFSLDDPSGEKRISEHDLVLRNKEGRFLGKKKGDTLVMEFALRNQYRFKAPGVAKITLINQFPTTAVEGIGGMSLVVRKK